MYNISVLDIDQSELIKIFKALIYSLYEKPNISDEKLYYVRYLLKTFSIDESEFEDIFILDMRYGFNYQKFLEEVSNNGSRLFLFLMYITAEIFDDSNVNKYIKNEILNFLHYDEKIQVSLKGLNEKYVELTLKINEAIYVDKGDKLEKYQIFSLTPNDKLDMIEEKEKSAFIKVFIYLMWVDNQINDVEATLIDIYMDMFEVSRDDIGDNKYYKNIEFLPVKEIKNEWLKLFLIYSFFVYKTGSKLDNMKKRFDLISKNFDITKENTNPFIKIIMEYRNCLIELLELVSNRDTTIHNEDYSNTKYVLNAVELALLFVPWTKVAYVARGLKGIRTVVSIGMNDPKTKEYGLCDIEDGKSQNTVIITIDGFTSEEQGVGQFNDWKDGLSKLKISSCYKGFRWKSCTFSEVCWGGTVAWYEAVENTEKVSKELVSNIEQIYKENPNSKIVLMGHSLGARIIYHTLIKLAKLSMQVEQIYMFGGAVASQNNVSWLSALSAVNESVYNFYSNNDTTLKLLYQGTKFETCRYA